jgi:hypothetical protein
VWLCEFKNWPTPARKIAARQSPLFEKNATDRDTALIFKRPQTQLGNGGKGRNIVVPQFEASLIACFTDRKCKTCISWGDLPLKIHPAVFSENP